MVETHYTFCRNCTAQCGLEIEVEGNRLLSVKGDRAQPVSKGYFCPKALSSNDLHNGEDRLGGHRQGRGAAQRAIGAEQAMDEIAGRLSEIINRHGSRAIGLYYGTGANMNSLAQSAFKASMHAIGSPYLFSSMTLDQSAKWVNIGRMGYFAPGPRYLHDADVGLLVGSNTVLTHAAVRAIPAAAPRKWLKQGKERGLKLIVVDPRLTETARLADLHLQIRPGEDVTLFAGMIRMVLENGWQDQAFCDRWIGTLDPLRTAVDAFALDHVAERCGLTCAEIESATELFATAARPTAATGTGPNMSPRSNLAEHMVQVLNAICAGYRRAGDPVSNTGYLFGPNVVQERILPPNRTWERGPKLRTRDIGPLFGEYPSALLPDEIVGHGEDRLRALIVVGGNPLMALVDPARSSAAFERLELLVTLDVRDTETTAVSDYVIATSLPYEHEDITGMFDNYNPVAYANVVPAFLDRPTGVIDDWEFFWGIGARMGHGLDIKRPQFGTAYENIAGPVLPLDMATKPTTETLVRFIASSFGASDYDELSQAPHGVLREDLISTVQPAEADDGSRLDVLPADVAVELIEALADESASDYPYLLTCRRMLEAMNGAYRNGARIRKRFPVNPAWMHPLDMATEGFRDGDAIVIESRHGEVVGYVKPDSTMRRGAISMTHLWGRRDASDDPDGRQGAFTGRLSSLDPAELEPINFMPIQSAIAIRVRAHVPVPSA